MKTPTAPFSIADHSVLDRAIREEYKRAPRYNYRNDLKPAVVDVPPWVFMAMLGAVLFATEALAIILFLIEGR